MSTNDPPGLFHSKKLRENWPRAGTVFGDEERDQLFCVYQNQVRKSPHGASGDQQAVKYAVDTDRRAPFRPVQKHGWPVQALPVQTSRNTDQQLGLRFCGYDKRATWKRRHGMVHSPEMSTIPCSYVSLCSFHHCRFPVYLVPRAKMCICPDETVVGRVTR